MVITIQSAFHEIIYPALEMCFPFLQTRNVKSRCTVLFELKTSLLLNCVD